MFNGELISHNDNPCTKTVVKLKLSTDGCHHIINNTSLIEERICNDIEHFKEGIEVSITDNKFINNNQGLLIYSDDSIEIIDIF